MAKKVLVTGATGFIGGALVGELLKQGYEVRALIRNPHSARQRLPREVELCEWGGDGSDVAGGALEDLDSIVHLAGESIAAGRWTESRKRALTDSRVLSTQALVRGLGALAADRRPRTFVCASAVGFYGDRGDELVDESSEAGRGFLAELCLRWEEASRPLEGLGIRRVNVRTGIVLHPSGGALAQLLKVFRLGLGGSVGSGRQYMSWIHRDDWVAAILFLLASESIQGPVNAVAPEPVTNREFSRTLGRVLGRPAILPVPAFALKLGLGEMADMLLEGQRVRPGNLESAGFAFRHRDLAEALTDLLRSPSSSNVST